MKTKSKQDKIAYVVMAQAEGYRPEVCPSVCDTYQLDREVWYAEQFFKQRQEEQDMNNVERDPMMPLAGSASNYNLPPQQTPVQEHPCDAGSRPCAVSPGETSLQELYTLVTRQLDGVRVVGKQLRELRDRLGGEYPPVMCKAAGDGSVMKCGIIGEIRADVVSIDNELCAIQTIIDQIDRLA